MKIQKQSINIKQTLKAINNNKQIHISRVTHDN